MADKTVEIEYQVVADIKQLLESLQTAEVAFDDLNEIAHVTGEGLEDFGKETTKVSRQSMIGGRALREMGSAIGIISPKAAQAVRALRGIRSAAIGAAAGAKAAGTSLLALAGPIALIGAGVAGLALVWREFAQDVEEAEARMADAAATTNRMAEAASAFKATQEGVNRSYAVFSGEITEAEQRIRDFTTALDEETRALKAEEFARSSANNQTFHNIRAIDENRNALVAKFTEMERAREEEKKAAEAARDQAEAERAAAKATRERAMEEAAAARARREQNARALADLDAFVEHSVLRTQEGAEALREFSEAGIASIDEFFAQHERDQEGIQQGVQDTLGATADISALLSDKLVEDNKRAAMALFRTSQASGIAQIGINTAVAASKALAELGPIAGPIAAGGMIAAGAAQAAVVIAQPPPVAHVGTPRGGTLAPDEAMSHGRRVLRGEMSTPNAVANTMGTNLIDDANNGKLRTNTAPTTAVIGRGHLDRELFRSGRSGLTRFSRQLRRNPHPNPQAGY